MGRKINNYIVFVPIRTLNIGDELLAHYSYKRPTSRRKAQMLELGYNQNVIKNPKIN